MEQNDETASQHLGALQGVKYKDQEVENRRRQKAGDKSNVHAGIDIIASSTC
jgi:hypothetical protein